MEKVVRQRVGTALENGTESITKHFSFCSLYVEFTFFCFAAIFLPRSQAKDLKYYCREKTWMIIPLVFTTLLHASVLNVGKREREIFILPVEEPPQKILFFISSIKK